MPIPSSGPISMSMFNTELGITSNLANSPLAGSTSPTLGPAFNSQFWRGGQSGSLSQKSPHSMSEWYNYTASAPTLTPLVYFDFANGTSWSGTGTKAINLGSGGSTYDADVISGSLFATASCSVPNYCGAFDSSMVANLLISGSTTIYSSNFTWILYHYMETPPTSQIADLIWSELSSGVKNFLWAYRNVGDFVSPNSPTYARIDTSTNVYNSTSAGTQFNGFGGVGGYLQLWHKTIATVLVKSGSLFTQYYHEPSGSLIKVWSVTINDWSISNTSQKISIGSKQENIKYVNDHYLYTVQMYTQSLTETQISQSVYTQLSNIVGGYCC